MSQRMNVRLGFSIILKQAECLDYSVLETLKFNSKNPNLEEFPSIDKVLVQKYQNIRDYVTLLTKDEIKSLEEGDVMVHIIFYPGNHEWHRVSDNIDSYLIDEDKALRGQVRYINSNLYPFNENKICLNNFNELPEQLSRQIFYKTQVDDELIALGFNNNQPLKEQFYMKAPLLVRNIARILNLNEEQIKQLRPTLVIYCS